MSDERVAEARLRTRDDAPRIADLERHLGDFLVEDELARTPRAVIYRIRAGSQIDLPLALKVALQPVEGEDLVRFQHEVRLLSEVRHPNVIEVYDFGVLPGGFPFLTMELLAGVDLMQVVQEGDWELFYTLAMQAAAGLSHIHRHGVVHLDVKPANLGLVGAEDGPLTLKILDFGLAQSVQGPLDRRIRGTLAYTAPEVLLQDRYDHRADLYSLGVTLFQLATGVLPSAGNDAAAIRFHLQAEAPDPLAYRPDLPGPLASILRRLLARDPQARFPSAAKLLLELADAAGREIDSTSMALGGGQVLASRLVGRDALLGRLEGRLQDAARGRCQVVLLEGAEGIGKSRLLREFRLRAAMQGARVGVGRALVTRPEPLRAVRAALRQLGIDVDALQRATVAEKGEPDRLFERLGGELIAAAAEGGPVVVVLEDLHLSGAETREWLAWMATECGDARILVVASRRAVEADGAAADWPGELGIERLEVAPLDTEAGRELIDASLGTEGLPPALYEWILERAEGHPAHIQQLLHHLIAERVLRFRHGEWKPSLPSLTRLATRTEELESLDRERLATLPAEELAVLEAAAAVAEPVPWRQWMALLDAAEEAVYAAVQALVAKGFLEVAADGEEPLYAFAHPGLARTVYDALAGERRRELHGRWAARLRQRLEAGEGELVAAVAEHLWLAGERRESVPFLRQAATRAREAYGHREEAELWGRIAEVAAESGDEPAAIAAQLAQAEALDAGGSTLRALSLYRGLVARGVRGRRADDRRRLAELWLRVGALYGKLGEAEEQLAASAQGLELLDGVEAPELEVDLLEGQAEAFNALSRLPEAIAAARRALRAATARQLTRQRAALLNILGLVACRQGAWRKGRFLLARGLRAALAAEDERLAARLRNNLGNLHWKQGNWREALAQYQGNLEAGQRIRDPWTELTALHNLGVLECGRGDWKAARAPLTRSLELRRRLGAREGETVAWLHLGEIEEQLGDWERAERHYRRVLKLLGEGSQHEDAVAAAAQLASLARKRGDWSEAEELARQALAASERLGDLDLLTFCHHQLGLVEKDREHWAPAAAHLARALELAESAGSHEGLARLHNSLADLALRRGERVEAERHAAAARRWAEQLADRFEVGKVFSAEARLALLEHDADRAEELFAQGVRTLEEIEVPFEYARTLYEWGVRTRNPEIAVERLDRALVAFERLGAATDFERTRGVIEGIRERHQLGAAAGRTPPGLWEVAKVINSTLDLQEVLDRTMDIVLERLRAERGMVVLAHPLTGELEVAVARNLGTDPEREGEHLSETVVRKVIESREPVLAVDALTDPRFAGAESIVASHIVSILCVPLVIRERLAGAIYIDHLRSQHLFGNKDLEFLIAFADQAALAIDNARLYGELDAHRRKLKAENEALRREILSSRHLGSLIGRSRVILQLKETLERVAQSNSTVLVRGESGTGKGMVARILHSVSPRREGPFIHFNCAALPETLVESELFGHEKGSFTGATGQKPGRFELAHKGTIFLDEIGKVSRSVQAKLLRVVEDREFERVGGTRTLKTDVRIVAATNLDLEAAIQSGEFREDLYYRLNIIPIVLPPLRERREDIPYLVEHFLEKISRDLGRPPKEIGPEVLDLFLSYRWPGNVRELEAAIHRALVLATGERLMVEDFGWIAGAQGVEPGAVTTPGAAVARLAEGNYQDLCNRFDLELVREALDRCGGKIRETARFLGIARNTLKAKLERYGLKGNDSAA